MEFIDKTKRKEEGHHLVNHFLDHQWKSDEGRYVALDFRKRTVSEHLKPKMKHLVVDEQKRYCCYCMRRINNGDSTTLEHIIPYATTDDEHLEHYLKYDVLRNNIVLQSVFEEATHRMATPPFPHALAYENITASCDGKFHDGIPNENSGKTCNLKRLNESIEPLFLIADIKQRIEYTRGGLIVSLDNAYFETLHTLNLNYITLQRIRSVWHLIAKHATSEQFLQLEQLGINDDWNTQNKRHKILVACLIEIKDINKFKMLIDKFKTQTFWNLLMKYNWFYHYYKNK